MFFAKRDPWPAVIEKASTSVVMLITQIVRGWEGTMPMPALASGFVVDRKLGIILTCRTVVTTGPITGKAMFLDSEETVITPLYVDPEHDFGFFKFDPKTIEYMPVTELPLYPQGAKVGVEVRVVGSDGGEKLMVLGGTISDCKRAAPDLSEGGSNAYSDVNTFYMTASSGTSEGSGGAPVLDSHGRVIALNAGGDPEAASSFFLPLHRVVRALERLRKNLHAPIPRGTIQTIFVYQAMDEVRRLGLPTEEETFLRKATKGADALEGTGALVVARPNVGGPGHAAGLRTGDVLVRVNKKPILAFLQLEEMLDESLEKQKELTFELYRGPALVSVKMKPQDMAATTLPMEFIEYSGAVIHPLGFQLSFFTEVPVNSVYVSASGYSLGHAGVQADHIIVEIGDIRIASLDDFESAICKYHDGDKVPIKHFALGRKFVEEVSVLTIDRKWFKTSRAKRQQDGTWAYKECPMPSTAAPDKRRPSLLQGRQVSFKHLNTVLGQQDGSTDTMTPDEGVTSHAIKNNVMKSLVWIEFSTPYRIDGIDGTRFAGCGIVLDADRGLVWADRTTVVSLLGNCKMVVASTFEIECKVVFLHPMANFAIIQYDPTLLGGTELMALELFSTMETAEETGGEPDLKRGDMLDFFGFTRQRRYHVVNGVKVTAMERASVQTPPTPCFVAKNFDAVDFDHKISAAIGGVYVDAKGRGRCILSNFGYTDIRLLSTLTAPVKHALRRVQQALDEGKDEVPPIHTLGIEFDFVQLSEARQTFGLTEEWAKLISNAADEDVSGSGHGTRDVLTVLDLLAGTTSSKVLKNGDLILGMEGKPLVSYMAYDTAASRAGDEGRLVKLTVLRDRMIFDVNVPTIPLSCTGTKRLVNFAGMQLQETHAHVAFHGFVPAFVDENNPGVYISSIARGSPSEVAGVSPVMWLAEIDATPIRTLDQVLETLKEYKHRDFLRLKVIGLSGDEAILTVELDLHFWRTSDLRYDLKQGTWVLTQHDAVVNGTHKAVALT